MNDFNFIIPLNKQIGDQLSGIASTTSVDRDDEKMSDTALKMMVDDIKTEGVNLFGDHAHNWENILGGIDRADLINKQVHIGINLNKANPKYQQLVGTINTKGVKVGLSVGGNVLNYKYEYDKTVGKKIKVLDKVKIYEVSVVGIPSNADSFLTIPQAIAKSAKLKTNKCPACDDILVSDTCDTCLWRN